MACARGVTGKCGEFSGWSLSSGSTILGQGYFWGNFRASTHAFRSGVLEPNDVPVPDRASIQLVLPLAVLRLEEPPVFIVVVLVEARHLLLARPFWVIVTVRVQPASKRCSSSARGPKHTHTPSPVTSLPQGGHTRHLASSFFQHVRDWFRATAQHQDHRAGGGESAHRGVHDPLCAPRPSTQPPHAPIRADRRPFNPINTCCVNDESGKREQVV